MNQSYPVDSECIFCRIVSLDASANIRYETDTMIAFDDINPKAPTHVLICPKGHYPTFLETPGDVLNTLHAEIKRVAEHLDLTERGFRLLVNNGPESGQIVYHLHFHLLAGRQMEGF